VAEQSLSQVRNLFPQLGFGCSEDYRKESFADPTMAIISPMEDVYGDVLAAVMVQIAQGMHCSRKCSTYDCQPMVHEWWHGVALKVVVSSW